MTQTISALALSDVSSWMMTTLKNEGCLYQQDVVDYLVKVGSEQYLKENSDGNLALSVKLINKFRADSGEDVVWVKSDMYWRFRVTEDEAGREARG